MLIFVLSLNLLIALLCWYGVQRIRRARQRLTVLADSLTMAEQRIFELLRQSPQSLHQGQQNIQSWRSQYQQLQSQIRQARQLLSLLGLGKLLWQQFGRQTPVRTSAATPAQAKLRSRGQAQRLSKS